MLFTISMCSFFLSKGTFLTGLNRKLYQVVQSLLGLHMSPQQSGFPLFQVVLYPPVVLENPEPPGPHVYPSDLKDKKKKSQFRKISIE